MSPLSGCKVCGTQYVGSTFTSFRARCNYYKSSSRQFSSGVAVAQAELFRHFTEATHHGFLDVSFQIIDMVFEVSRHKEGFWQFRLQSLFLMDLTSDMWIISNPLCTFPLFIASLVQFASIQHLFFSSSHFSHSVHHLICSVLSSF